MNMLALRSKLATGLLIVASIVVTGCGKGGGWTNPPAGPSYSIGGNISGLVGSVVLQDNSADNLTVSANGSFTFATRITGSRTYNITVLTQPTGQTCTVSSGSGTVSADVSNVTVNCTNNSYTIGGTVSGLSGTVVLQDNSGDDRTISANGSFVFATPITNGGTYSVSVLTQPASQTCSVSTGSGTVSGSNVTNVSVVCSNFTYNVGGTVSGLSGTVVLQDNGGDNRTISSNGAFTFATQVADGSPYSVTVLTQPTGQSCSVSSGSGTISGAAVTTVSVTCATNTYTIGGTVTGLSGNLVLQDNAGDDLPLAVNGSFSFATAIAYGNTYSVSILNQPSTVFCTVGSGSGTVTANISSVTVSCAPNVPRFAYVANANDNTVSIFSVNASTGQLRHNGYVAAGTNPHSVTVDPSGKFAYVANNGSNNVSAYTIDASTGALTSVGAVAAGSVPYSVTVAPSGKYVYVASSGSGVYAFLINTGTGALSAVAGSPFAAGTNPQSVAVDPTGKFAYAANYGSDDVSAYTINSGTGALSSIGATVPAGTQPYSVTVDPSGKFAYAANFGSNDVSVYSINAGSGVLTQVLCGGGAGCNVDNFQAGTMPYFVSVDPGSKFAYVANFFSNDVSAYTINSSTGALTSVGSPVAAGTWPSSITVDPSGKFAYVTNNSDDDITSFSINSGTGALTAPATLAGRDAPESMAITRGTTAVTYTPKFAYVANSNSNDVSAYSINVVTGALLSLGVPVGAGTTPYSVTVDPLGRFAYVANFTSDNISAFTIDAGTGALGSVGGVGAGTNPMSVAVDPSGRFAYSANSGSNDVSAYTINPSTGALLSVAGSPFTAGTNPLSVTVDPTGKFAFVVNSVSNDVSVYTINASTGALTQVLCGGGAGCNVDNFLAGTNPIAISVDASGKYAYVANSGSNDISGYSINGSTGALTSLGVPVPAGSTPYSISIDPLGRFAYVANNGSNDVSGYSIDGSTGALLSVGATVPAGTGPYAVNIDPSGSFVYVANQTSGDVSAYTITSGTGVLTSAGSLPAGTQPTSVSIAGTIQ